MKDNSQFAAPTPSTKQDGNGQVSHTLPEEPDCNAPEFAHKFTAYVGALRDYSRKLRAAAEQIQGENKKLRDALDKETKGLYSALMLELADGVAKIKAAEVQVLVMKGEISIITNERAALKARLADALAALNAIASWKEGTEVNSSFDEPNSAFIARAAIDQARRLLQ